MIDHQGNPGQRMPEAGIGGRKGPPEGSPGKAGKNLIFLDHIDMIVKKNKIKEGQLSEDSKDSKRQTQADHILPEMFFD
jgi:hypothetical protein